MGAFGVRSSFFVSCVLGSALCAISCGEAGDGGGSGGKASAGTGTGGASAATGGASSGTSGTAGSSSATGGAGGTTGGAGGSTGGSATGGTTGGAMSGTGGGTGGGTMTGGAAGMSAGGAGGAGASTTGGSGGMPAGGGEAGDTGGSSSGKAGSGASGSSGSGGGGLPGAVPSDGCTMGTPLEAGTHMISTGGMMRSYILRLPANYDNSVPHRIVFAFHGAQGSAEQVDSGAPANTDSPETGPFYGIYDESVDTIFVAGQADSTWNTSSTKDVDYVKAIIAEVEGSLCVDQTRRFGTGFSMGAIMTINNVACKMADLFRAVAPMSGQLADCPGSTPIAYWASHGTNDGTINISNGREARDEFVTRNGCDMTSMPTDREGCVAYQGCDPGYPVEWCEFDGVHQPYPDSGPAIWEFLSQF